MLKKVTLNALLIASCAMVCAQAVQVAPHTGAVDLWGGYFNSGHKITFTGRVTGIESTKVRAGADSEITLLVRSHDGGGTAVVDLGPAWYVNHQVAKIKVKDQVQVTGSKVMVDGHGILLASMIVLHGQGGPVVSLRRPSGRAYWMGTEVASDIVVPTGPNVVRGTVTQFNTYNVNNVPWTSGVIQTDNGQVTVNLGPQWYYGQQDVVYNVGDHVQVVTGGSAITVGPNNQIYPTYSVYRGNSIYSVRSSDGTPLYYWQ